MSLLVQAVLVLYHFNVTVTLDTMANAVRGRRQLSGWGRGFDQRVAGNHAHRGIQGLPGRQD